MTYNPSTDQTDPDYIPGTQPLPTTGSQLPGEPMGGSAEHLEPDPGPEVGARARSGRAVDQFLQVGAVVILALCLAAGAWIAFGSVAQPSLGPIPYQQLNQHTAMQAYGGDAYTGIQNAAADTANAVTNGVNSLNQTQVAAARAAADYQGELLAAQFAPLRYGVAVIIVAAGLINLTVTLAFTGRRV
ncbi:hypothetical protein VRY54_08480 [Actinomyces sp. F1_1611]